MADYIDDTGLYGFDAELSGTYTTQAANHALTLGSDGEADTGFTLPTATDWLLIETYNVENVATDIGYTKWQSDVSNVSVTTTGDIQVIWGIVDADSAITNFEMVATHYKSATGKVDVYRTDETANFSTTPDDPDVDFTFPIGNWKITDTLIAPDSVVNEYTGDIVADPSGDFTFTEIVADSGDWNVVFVYDATNFYSFAFAGFGDATSQHIELSFDATLNSGTFPMFDQYYSGSGSVNLPNGDHRITEGANTIELYSYAGASPNCVHLFIDPTSPPTASFDMDIENVVLRRL